jgi:protein phosphatase
MSQPGPTPEPQSDSFQQRLEVDKISDLGLQRTNNEDSMVVVMAASKNAWLKRGDLFVVADGMGGHSYGELASKLSIDTVPLVYHKLADRTAAEALMAAVEDANTQIHVRGKAIADAQGQPMGTTTTALALLPYGALLAHVGDSRAYRLRGTRFEQLSFDHSVVWEMRAAGLDKDQVPDYLKRKNVITRSLGPNPSVQVDLEGPHPIVPGDTFLLCSDGLSGQVRDDEMGMIVGSMSPSEAVRSLVDIANLRGGPDNISVIVAKTAGTGWTQSSADIPQPRAATRPINVNVWIAMGVLTLLGLGLLAFQWIPAAICLVAAGVLGVGAWFYSQGGEVKGPAMNGKRYGRGPYTAIVCPPSPEFVRRLAEMLRELREAASRDDVEVNVAGLNPILDRAAAGNQAGDNAQAVRYYCEAIGFLIAEFKRQGKSGKT